MDRPLQRHGHPMAASLVQIRRPRRRYRGVWRQRIRRGLLAAVLFTLFGLPLTQMAAASALGSGTLEAAPGSVAAAAASVPGAASTGRALVGSLWSMEIAGVEVADPLAVASVIATGRPWAFVLAALIPFLSTFFLGRVFCGWICPARLPVELAAAIRTRVRWRRKPIAVSAPWLRRAKYAVLAVGLVWVTLTGWNVLALIYPPAVFEREVLFALSYGAFGGGAIFLGLAFVADIFVEHGMWCRGLCPGGALYSLIARLAPLKVRVNASACVDCPLCREACPLGLDPPAGNNLGECDRCGLCQTSCPKDAIDYRVSAR